MPFCAFQDVTLYYETQGQGPSLLFLAGLSGGTWSWTNQIPFFQNHYFTLTLDNRGAGKSSIPNGPYTMQQFATDALHLLDSLEIEQTLVLGVSMGGMIAQELALLAPHRITALALGCTHCGGNTRVPPKPQALHTLLDNAGLTQEEIVDKNLPIFFSENCLQNKPHIIHAYRQVQLAAPPQEEYAFQAQLAAIRTFHCCDRLTALSMPVLILTGTQDELVPMANAASLAQIIAHAQLIEIPNAGHALHVECRDPFNAIVHDFFQQHTHQAENISSGTQK